MNRTTKYAPAKPASTVPMADADHDGPAAAVDAPDPVPRAEVVDVEVERSRMHGAEAG